jgi:hypothetical protein
VVEDGGETVCGSAELAQATPTGFAGEMGERQLQFGFAARFDGEEHGGIGAVEAEGAHPYVPLTGLDGEREPVSAVAAVRQAGGGAGEFGGVDGVIGGERVLAEECGDGGTAGPRVGGGVEEGAQEPVRVGQPPVSRRGVCGRGHGVGEAVQPLGVFTVETGDSPRSGAFGVQAGCDAAGGDEFEGFSGGEGPDAGGAGVGVGGEEVFAGAFGPTQDRGHLADRSGGGGDDADTPQVAGRLGQRAAVEPVKRDESAARRVRRCERHLHVAVSVFDFAHLACSPGSCI